jgi:hypothetical protein
MPSHMTYPGERYVRSGVPKPPLCRLSEDVSARGRCQVLVIVVFDCDRRIGELNRRYVYGVNPDQ